MVISSGMSNASMRTVSLRRRRMEYSTKSFASLSNRGSRIGRLSFHQRSRMQLRRLLRGADKPRRVSAVKTIAKRQQPLLVFEAQAWPIGENSSHDLLVFFRFEAAGAVNENALRFQQRDERPGKRDLLFLHAQEIRWA